MSSKYAELVESETVEDEDETEDPAPDEEPGPDPVPEPEPEQPAVTEKDLKALERVRNTYTAGLQRVMGDDFLGLHVCPRCSDGVPGFLFQEPNPGDVYETDNEKERCRKCDGYGQLYSGSRTDNALVMCMACTGNGYVNKTLPPPPVQDWSQGGTPQVPPGYLPPSSSQMPTRDQWGRDLGHPQFGQNPNDIGR
jgi:hypothetical protein